MKKFYLIMIFLFCLQITFAQWTKINAIPNKDIVALTVNNNTIYAASFGNMIYRSNDGGVVWEPIKVSNSAIEIVAIAFYHNTIYIGTFNFGVYFSTDNGATWQNKNTGSNWISKFSIKNDVLYASTLGTGVEVLNPVTNTWSFLNNSLPSYSVNVEAIISSPNYLLIAAGANGTFYRYNFASNSWNEEYYDGTLHPGLQIDNLINSDDTILAVNFNRIIRSNNSGLSWTNDKVGTHTGVYRNISAGKNNYYTITNVIHTVSSPEGTWIQQRSKHAVAGTSWATNEEFVPDGFSYDILEFNNKLFLAKADGLYVKDLPVSGPLPVRFVLFNTECEVNKVVVNWITAQEENSSRFDIERSSNGINWTVIAHLPATGNSNSNVEKSYSYTDNEPVQGSYYRIAEYDIDGRVYYTNILHSSCSITDAFSLWPNPVKDVLNINIVSSKASEVTTRMFDGRGALVKTQQTNILQGSNQYGVDMRSLAPGVYILSLTWNKGETGKTVQVLKQ